MKFLTEEIISSTEITKNYKLCRDKTKRMGKTVIFKNNVPDMVLLDIHEYEMMNSIVEELEYNEIYNMLQERQEKDNEKSYSLQQVKDIIKSKRNDNMSVV